MKKIILLSILTLSLSANAQSIQPPRSMANKVTAPAIIPAQSAALASPQPNSEAQGYSVAFLAYHYNDFCKLNLSKPTIDNLARQLEQAEKDNQITQATIDKNVADADRIYKENPAKFCADAQQIAGVIKQLFADQPEGNEQVHPAIKQMYLNQ